MSDAKWRKLLNALEGCGNIVLDWKFLRDDRVFQSPPSAVQLYSKLNSLTFTRFHIRHTAKSNGSRSPALTSLPFTRLSTLLAHS